MDDSRFARLAYLRLANGQADLGALSERLGMRLSELAARLEGSTPFTLEEAVDLIRESDDLHLLRWLMERLGMRKIELDDEQKDPERGSNPFSNAKPMRFH